MRILIIEDEHKIAQAIKRGLEQETYAVDLAYDGKRGLEMALSGDYDVIVMDLMLPEIDGLVLCQELRDEKIHTPILMLTAKGSLEDKVIGLNLGADDYLVKPFAFEELLARIKALTRRPQKQRGLVLAIKDLTLNTVTYEVKRDGQQLELSRKEYAVLEYLMRHPGRVLSKDQIINQVWNYDSEVLPNTVEVYIGYLRNKVDKIFKNRPALLQTVRGFGYKIG